MSGENCFGFIKRDKKVGKRGFIELEWISYKDNFHLFFILICNIGNDRQIVRDTFMRNYWDMTNTGNLYEIC